MGDMLAKVFYLGYRRESMPMEDIVEQNRFLFCGYILNLSFLWMKRHVPGPVRFPTF